MIGDTLMYLHLVGAHDFARLPQEIPPGFSTAQVYGAVLHALLNDSRRIRVDRKKVTYQWIDGRVISVPVPNRGNNVVAFVQDLLVHDEVFAALFKEVISLGGGSALSLAFHDPSPLLWEDLIRAGRDLEREMQPPPLTFLSVSFYAARKRIVEGLAQQACIRAAAENVMP